MGVGAGVNPGPMGCPGPVWKRGGRVRDVDGEPNSCPASAGLRGGRGDPAKRGVRGVVRGPVSGNGS